MWDYQTAVKQQLRWLRYIVLVLAGCTLITLGHRIWLGLLIGSVTSYTNLWLLQRNMNNIVEVAIGNRRYASAGTISRIGSALLVVALARYFDQFISFFAVVMGLMLKYVVILLESCYRVRTENIK
ncbi:ATP synthase protein I [Amphibacillus marinus]|uniref:ATP synthase protein I n=1 Tax=Amphibacillus marinus TaxID=872970 RepID=A0A1H8N1S0_9BACI|nr:ATP synthase subunit I [Amphibacillus marinus]SEO23466.1 ATP synthase protein I [Amphibacillus marinus]